MIRFYDFFGPTTAFEDVAASGSQFVTDSKRPWVCQKLAKLRSWCFERRWKTSKLFKADFFHFVI